MAKLYFRYGAMNASKSLQLLTVAHNYEEQGKTVLCFIPQVDNRFGDGIIASRIGVTRPAIKVHEDFDMFEAVKSSPVDCVLVDEAQFLDPDHVRQLTRVADELNVPVLCYGLLKDFRNKFFPGSEALVLWSDNLEEIKTICEHEGCTRKATMIRKVVDGRTVYDGNQVEIGDSQYHSVCRRHYFHPDVLKTRR